MGRNGNHKKSARTAKDIVAMLETHRDEIKRLGVKKLGLFGSFLKGHQKRGSDLDFLVVFDKPGFDAYMELKFLLQRIFRKKVDLVVEESL